MSRIPANWRDDQSYQKQPGYNWRVDPYYRLDKDHPVAFNRPQVQALIGKLRKMEMMKQPGTAEEVIYDIAFTQLYDRKQEVRLAKIAARLTSMWVTMRGNEDIFGPPEPQSVEQAAQLPALVTEPTPTETGTLVHQMMEKYQGFAAGGPDLNDKQLKLQAQNVIENHYFDFPRGLCGCGRPYATESEWANHLRIRLWNLLKNEFPPIGTVDVHE